MNICGQYTRPSKGYLKSVWSWYFMLCLSGADHELLLMHNSVSASDAEASNGPEAVGFTVVCSFFALWVSSAVEQHDLVYLFCRQLAVQVSWHLHHCVVDSSICLYNCASCTWSLSWYPQTLHEDTSQDLWGELGVYLMHHIVRSVQNQNTL